MVLPAVLLKKLSPKIRPPIRAKRRNILKKGKFTAVDIISKHNLNTRRETEINKLLNQYYNEMKPGKKHKISFREIINDLEKTGSTPVVTLIKDEKGETIGMALSEIRKKSRGAVIDLFYTKKGEREKGMQAKLCKKTYFMLKSAGYRIRGSEQAEAHPKTGEKLGQYTWDWVSKQRNRWDLQYERLTAKQKNILKSGLQNVLRAKK